MRMGEYKRPFGGRTNVNKQMFKQIWRGKRKGSSSLCVYIRSWRCLSLADDAEEEAALLQCQSLLLLLLPVFHIVSQGFYRFIWLNVRYNIWNHLTIRDVDCSQKPFILMGLEEEETLATLVILVATGNTAAAEVEEQLELIGWTWWWWW